MGVPRFHYITNWVWFYTGNTYCFSENSEHTSFETFSNTWFYQLQPGQRIMRAVEQNGFSCLTTGKINCRFSFPGATIKTGDWKRIDGRVWLGDIFVEKELVIK